jgi:hypothetical protein
MSHTDGAPRVLVIYAGSKELQSFLSALEYLGYPLDMTKRETGRLSRSFEIVRLLLEMALNTKKPDRFTYEKNLQFRLRVKHRLGLLHTLSGDQLLKEHLSLWYTQAPHCYARVLVNLCSTRRLKMQIFHASFSSQR